MIIHAISFKFQNIKISFFKTHSLRWHHELLKGIYGYNIDLVKVINIILSGMQM